MAPQNRCLILSHNGCLDSSFFSSSLKAAAPGLVGIAGFAPVGFVEGTGLPGATFLPIAGRPFAASEPDRAAAGFFRPAFAARGARFIATDTPPLESIVKRLPTVMVSPAPVVTVTPWLPSPSFPQSLGETVASMRLSEKNSTVVGTDGE